MGNDLLEHFLEMYFRDVDWIALMHIYDAYFDESGTDDNSLFTCVGGFLFKKSELLAFNKGWKRNVKPFLPALPDGSKIFHATDCFQGQGAFRDMRVEDRMGIFKKMGHLINKTARYGVVIGIEKKDYKAAVKSDPKLRKIIGSDYALCACRCVEYVGYWLTRNRLKGNVLYIYEESDKSNEAVQMVEMMRNNPYQKERCHICLAKDLPKNRAIALQAADLLVWEWRRIHHYVLSDKNPNWEITLSQLGNVNLQGETLTKEGTWAKVLVNLFYGIKSHRTYRGLP